MQTLKVILFLLALPYLLILPSCDGVGCGRKYNFASHNVFGFNVLDKNTRQNVMLIGQTKYFYDTVKVYHENWDVAYRGPVPGDGLFGLYFIDPVTDKNVVNKRITRRFYMYFDYQDIDTIDIAFEMKYDKCHDQVMGYFKVAYNDSVYFDGPSEIVVGENFLK